MNRSQAMLMVAGAVAALPSVARAATPRQPKMAIDYPFPPMDVVDRDGKLHTIPPGDGLPLLLTFFASWCGPCRQEIPNLMTALHRYEGKLAVIGFDLHESVEKANAYIDEMKIAFPVATRATTDEDFFGKSYTLPFGILISRDGIIKDIWNDYEEGTNPLWGRLIKVGLR